MLLCYQSSADTRAKMFLEEMSHLARSNVPSALEKATCKVWNRIAVSLDKICHYLSELYLFLNRLDRPVGVGKKGGEGVQICIVYFRYMRIRYHNEREIAEGLQTMRKTDGDQGQGEVGGGQEGGIAERWTAMS